MQKSELYHHLQCLSLCKINHLLRTVPPDKVPTQLQLFDHNLHRSLEGIVNCSVSESSWLQATLPIRLVGLGLREACRSSPAAYLASSNHSRELASRLLTQGLHFAQSCSNTCELSHFAGGEVARERLHQFLPEVQFTAETTSQHQLQLLLDSRIWSHLRESASIRDRARINTLVMYFSTLFWWMILDVAKR